MGPRYWVLTFKVLVEFLYDFIAVARRKIFKTIKFYYVSK